MPQHFKIIPSLPLALGWIPYWNLLPLRQELERSAGGEIELHKGHPSQVNRWLSEGRIALAPSSSVCLVKNSQLEIAFPLGIAATGPVQSVYLGVPSDDPLLLETIRTRQAMVRDLVRQAQGRMGGDARKLASHVFKAAAMLPPVDPEIPPPLVVTAASASGASLARILYRLWFGEAAYELRASESATATAAATLSLRKPLELVIGDEALVRRPSFRNIIDLGEAWRDLTDLPFVFAVWQTSRKTLSPHWRQRLFEAAELAQARMRVEPCHYIPSHVPVDAAGKTIDLASYWKCIQYRLGPQHFKGLALFLALTRCLMPLAVDDQAIVNITKWEALGVAAQR